MAKQETAFSLPPVREIERCNNCNQSIRKTRFRTDYLCISE